MKPAPPFDCASCGRRIGKVAGHWIVDGTVWCTRCVERANAYDRSAIRGSRAAVAARLGLWP